jgi:hypothetical protein
MYIECVIWLLVAEISGCDKKAIREHQRLCDCNRKGIIEHWKLFGSNREETTETGGYFISTAWYVVLFSVKYIIKNKEERMDGLCIKYKCG